VHGPEGRTTTESLVAEDVASCSNNANGQLLSGYVRFARTDGGGLTAADSENPSGVPLDLDVVLTLTTTHPQPPVCFDDAQSVARPAAPDAAVPSAGPWRGGDLLLRHLQQHRKQVGWSVAHQTDGRLVDRHRPGMYKVCRYTPLNSDDGTRNADHPLDYVAPSGTRKSTSLTNQNFLVISSLHTCPTDTPTDGDFINSNTRLHQDGSSFYNNGP
jgi:hypothetical protein